MSQRRSLAKITSKKDWHLGIQPSPYISTLYCHFQEVTEESNEQGKDWQDYEDEEDEGDEKAQMKQ